MYIIIDLFRRKLIALLLLMKNILGIQTSTIKLSSGQLFSFRNNDIVGLSIYTNAHFEQKTREAILSQLRQGMTVLDIGANIGYYTLQISQVIGGSGHLIAFEPNPTMIEQLEINIKLNNLNNLTVEAIALSDTNGKAEFCSPKPGRESHGSLMPNDTFETIGRITVKTEKLDDSLKRLGVKKVDFIKLDAEGAEMLIFKGAQKLLSNDNKPVIIFECAENLCRPFNHSVFDVLVYLNSFNYSIEEIDYGMWLATPSN